MAPKKIKVVDVINEIEDIPEHFETDIKAIENTDTIDEEQPAIENDTQLPLGCEPETNENPPTNIKTVEMVECPDCKKKMTKKSLKYSHAKNCSANKKPKEEEEEEEVTASVKPIIKRTISVIPEKQPIPVKKTIEKVKREKVKNEKEGENKSPQGEQVSQQPQITPTITNIYGREHRNERVKHKTHKMNTLFVNAI